MLLELFNGELIELLLKPKTLAKKIIQMFNISVWHFDLGMVRLVSFRMTHDFVHKLEGFICSNVFNKPFMYREATLIVNLG